MDPALEEAVKHVGYLGTHMGAFFDYVYAYVHFDEGRLFRIQGDDCSGFRGRINRPKDVPSQVFMIKQT